MCRVRFGTHRVCKPSSKLSPLFILQSLCFPLFLFAKFLIHIGNVSVEVVYLRKEIGKTLPIDSDVRVRKEDRQETWRRPV